MDGDKFTFTVEIGYQVEQENRPEKAQQLADLIKAAIESKLPLEELYKNGLYRLFVCSEDFMGAQASVGWVITKREM